MSTPQSSRDPMGFWALLVNLVPFVTGLALLGLKYQVGPRTVLYWASQVGGFFQFGCIVAGSALTLIAHMRAERPDWRAWVASLLLVMSIVEVIIFFN